MAAVRLVVVVALAREARLVRRALRAGGIPDVGLVMTGMGPGLAGGGVRDLIADGAGCLAAIGLAGALAPDLRAGDLLLPEGVGGEDGTLFDADSRLRAAVLAALAALAPVRGGLLVSVPRPLASPCEKRRLARRCGAIAVDMESAAVAREAAGARVPFVALRVVSDVLDQPLPRTALEAVDAFGRPRPAALAAGLARRPAETVALLRLARGVSRAERALGRALAAALPVLAASGR